MKNILIIQLGQFGSETITYNYCLLLKDKYKINYIGFDDGLPNKNIEEINYVHLSQQGNGLTNRFLIYKTIYKELKKTKYDFILINYFIFCSLIRLLSKNKMAVEILTAYISPNKIKRIFYNTLISLESRFFKHIITTTEGMVKYLFLPKRTHIRPNGANPIPFCKKDFDSLRILYVGTFHNRNITNTIHAYTKFFHEYKNLIKTNYTIIGFGSKVDTNEIIDLINDLGMKNQITFKGEIRRPELDEYFKINNVGMSYIPINNYFDHQAPLKSYEYLLSGLSVLATATEENKKIITSENGVIIEDSIDDIYNGLKQIYNNRFLYNSESIKKEAQNYSWENIIKENLIPYIESL